MTSTHSNFRFLEPEIAKHVEAMSEQEQRQLAVYVAEQTIKKLDVTGERSDNALEALRSEKYGDTPESKASHELARELDTQAFDAQDKGDDAAYNLAFCKARAVSALVAASYPDASKAISETLYEAYYAVDSNGGLLLKWINDFKGEQE
jgi:hypothetical protein